MKAWGRMDDGAREEEENGMENTLRSDEGRGRSEKPEASDRGRDSNPPRTDLPDWMEKELFRIFL